MVIIVFYWLYIAFLGYAAGHALLKGLCKSSFLTDTPPFTLTVLTGFAGIGVLSMYFSLFARIDLAVHAILASLILVYATLNWRAMFSGWRNAFTGLSKTGWVLLALAAVVNLIYAAAPSQTYDEGLYYAQNIRWIQLFGIVPGLGNLHGRLAFDSGWHLVAAFFKLGFLYKDGFDDLNALMCLLMALYAIQSLKQWQSPLRLSTFMKVAMVPPLFLLYVSVMGPAADLAVTFTIWLTVILFIEKYEAGTLQQWDWRSLLIYLLPAFLLTVKISSAPLLILPLYLFIRQWPVANGRKWTVLLLGLLVVAPWFARNYVLSGYLVYPVKQTAVGHPDWQVPVKMVEAEQLSIKTYARVPHVDMYVVDRMPFMEWFRSWWKARRIYDCMLMAWLVLSFGIMLAALLRYVTYKTQEKAIQGPLPVIGFTLAAGVLFWWWAAPDPRFGHGFIWFFCVFAAWLALPAKWKAKGLVNKKLLPPIFAFSFLAQLAMLLFLVPVKSITDHIMKPAPLPSVPMKTVEVSGTEVKVPATGNQCWNTEVPCTPIVPQGLQMRGHTLQEGFRINAGN